MAEVEISYKGSNIATMNASGTKTLLTEAKYLEDDVTITYARPSAPSGTKNISITANGVTTEDVTNYASAQITANVPNTYAAGDEGKVVSNGALVAQGSDTVTENDTYDTTLISSLTVNVSGGGGGGYGEHINLLPGAQSLHSINGMGLNAGLKSTRMLFATLFGTDELHFSTSATTGSGNLMGMYTFDRPQGATKLSVSLDKTCQVYVNAYHHDSNYVSDGNSGWVNAPLVDYALPANSTFYAVMLRVDSNNTVFAAQNTPTSATITFT